MLRTVALSWQQETLAENAREVKDLGAELYERLRTWTGHMQTLQKSLTSSVDAYNRAVGSLESRVLVTARKFPSLGVVGSERADITELSPIEAAPRHLQAVEPDDDESAGRRRGRRGAAAEHPPVVRRRGQRSEAPAGLTRRVPARGAARRAGKSAGPRRTSATYSARVLHVHRSERADDAGGGPGRAGGRSARRPDGARGGLGADTRHRAVADAAPVEPARAPHDGGHDGVCANIDFPFPGTLGLGRAWRVRPTSTPTVGPVAARAGGVAAHGGGRGALRPSPWLAPLATAHPQNSRDGARVRSAFSSIRHVADLFDRYAVHRPDMLQRWAAGSAQLDEATWQVELWRLLRERIGQPSPAERLRRRLPAAAQGARRCSTSRPGSRCSVSPGFRPATSTCSRRSASGRDVHLFLLHPSPRACGTGWRAEVDGDVAPSAPAERPDRGACRATRCSRRGVATRVRCSWCSVARSSGESVGPGARDRRPTLLQRIQDDIRSDRAPGAGAAGTATATPGRCSTADDDSIRVHSCHGRGRQVEVLRDAVLHLLADDPDARARDIIVMCPDIEHFAPLIQATFGVHDETREPATQQLQIRLADRSLRQTNPVMGVLADVLELATARITATEVLDLAGREPVRRRFHFCDDDLFRAGGMGQWCASCAGASTPSTASRSSLSGIAANTWHAGLDRILLGVAMADERSGSSGRRFRSTTSTAATSSWSGGSAEFLTRLRAAVDALDGSPDHRRVGRHAGGGVRLAHGDLTVRRVATVRAHRPARGVGRRGDGGRRDQRRRLSCDDVRSLLAERLKGRPTRANFRTGHLTVCTLVPMRSIPHRVVCLLGLDDGSFPRHVERDGDDITAQAPRVGDRDPRSEDRQLLLDAVLAAQDHLVITYSGRDERSNLHRPPAVPVGELLDVVDRTVRAANGPRP